VTTVAVCETFESIQGESTFAGLSCFFVRLSGCNLRCRYCDTTYAYGPGRPVAVGDLAAAAAASRAAIVEVTGGEPLLQNGFAELAVELRDRCGRPVLVETNGSLDISVVPREVVAVMDVKCPGSGEAERMDWANLGRLRPYDEVKFVLMDRADYEWARSVVAKHNLAAACRAVLLSPAWGRLDPARIGEWMLEDGLRARLQVPLHKALGVK